MTKLTTLTGDIDARDLAQIRAFADRMLQGETPTQPPQWTREDLIDALAEVITDTHDMDVRDVDYARNIVDWINANMMPIPEDKG